MRLLIEEIAEYLDAMGYGSYNPVAAGGSIFLNVYPERPDDLVYIRNTTGLDSDLRFKTDILGIQIICRGNENLGTYKKAKTIFDLLHGYNDSAFVANGLYVESCLGGNSGPTPIGTDSQGRNEFSMNFLIECERST